MKPDSSRTRYRTVTFLRIVDLKANRMKYRPQKQIKSFLCFLGFWCHVDGRANGEKSGFWMEDGGAHVRSSTGCDP